MNKFNIIKINGFKGLALALFCVGCLIAGFLIFPGWVCMHVWNYIASFFFNMPTMNLLQGGMLWCIIALSMYAMNKGALSISFSTAAPMRPNDEKLKEILSKIHERNSQLMTISKNTENVDSSNDILDVNSSNSDDLASK